MPAWAQQGAAGGAHHRSQNVARSKMEEVGPTHTMNLLMSLADQGRGCCR